MGAVPRMGFVLRMGSVDGRSATEVLSARASHLAQRKIIPEEVHNGSCDDWLNCILGGACVPACLLAPQKDVPHVAALLLACVSACVLDCLIACLLVCLLACLIACFLPKMCHMSPPSCLLARLLACSIASARAWFLACLLPCLRDCWPKNLPHVAALFGIVMDQHHQ